MEEEPGHITVVGNLGPLVWLEPTLFSFKKKIHKPKKESRSEYHNGRQAWTFRTAKVELGLAVFKEKKVGITDH